jgi:hypothetical protein
MEAQECGGLWWLPGSEERVAGILKISPSGSMKLSLLGRLGPDVAFRPEKRHPIILGSVSRSPKGNDITLTGSFLVGSTIGSFLHSREEYHVGRGYFGALLGAQSDFAFVAARLQLGGLAEWIHNLSGFERAFARFAQVGQTVSLGSYTKREPATADVPGARVLAGFALGGHMSMTEHVFREEAEVKVLCQEPMTADEIIQRYVYALRNLMTFASDAPQPIERLSVYHREAPDDEILVLGELIQPEAREGKRPASWHEMLFTMKEVDFSDFLPKWLALTSRHSAVCNVFFGIMYGPPSFVDITFQSVTNAVQLYFAGIEEGGAQRAGDEARMKAIQASLPESDREWLVDRLGDSPKAPFRAALHTLVEKHGEGLDPLIGGRRGRFIDAVLGTHEYLLWRDPGYERASSYGADLYWLMQKLRFLLKACFLHEVGFSASDIRACFGRNALFQHIYQLQLADEAGSGGGHDPRAAARQPAAQPRGEFAPKGSPDFDEFWEHLQNESARSRAVVIGAYFDDRLGGLLGTPDESLRSKIETAHREGFLTANEREDLQRMRELRNFVVHELGGPRFSEEEREIVEGLKTWQIAAVERPTYVSLFPTPEDRLLYVAAVIAGRLKDRKGGSTPLPEPDLTDVNSWPPVAGR